MTSFQYDIEISDYNLLNPEKFKMKDHYTINNSIVKFIPIKDNKNNQNIFLLTPWTKIRKYCGIQNYNNSEINPKTFKIGFNEYDISHLNFINKIKEFDNYFSSDEFKHTYIFKDFNGIYTPIYNNEFIKSKIDYDKEDNINTSLYKTFSFSNKFGLEFKCNNFNSSL
jgi:hypothetical protein